jgi:para-nitrobenzyl esterase
VVTHVTIETTHGKVKGEQRQGHLRFRGIPFAAPPVGALRFAAPAPARPWAGVRAALAYADSAHQPKSALPGMAVGPQSEDCLYLNVFTPAADDARRPVMVWIHGGGFVTGGACQALYEGGPLVVRGDVVLVTLNYRLGMLGYLDLPELRGAVPNAGQLDQIAALEWVRDNIALFGGDPGNVTIFGESAGGMAVSTLLAMPAARGLFHKAIAQSGAGSSCLDRESAERVADAWLRRLGLGRDTASKLREVGPDALIAAQVAAAEDFRDGRIFLAAAPVVDGESLPTSPLEAVRGGGARDVPLLTGTTLDEWRLFEMPSLIKDLDRARVLRRLGRMLPRGADADALLEAYAAARGEDPADPEQAKSLYLAIRTDRVFRIPAIRLAEAHAAHQEATFMYLFSWPSPARRGELGACHAIELAFVFGTLDAPGMDRFAGAGPAAERLSARTMDAWLAFARSGSPGHGALPEWERYETARRSTMQLDAEPSLVDGPMDHERAAWDGIPG